MLHGYCSCFNWFATYFTSLCFASNHLCYTGGTPYAEILPFDVYSQLCGGMRLPKPMHCAQEVYDIVKICWAKVPTERPSFVVLHERLDAMTQSKMVSNRFSKQGYSLLYFLVEFFGLSIVQ